MDLQRTKRPVSFGKDSSVTKRSTPLSQPKYTTRQIMELTERRRQAEAAAAAAQSQLQPQPQPVQAPQDQRTDTQPVQAPIIETPPERISGDLFILKEEAAAVETSAQEAIAASSSLAETEQLVREKIMDYVPRSASVKSGRGESSAATSRTHFKSLFDNVVTAVMEGVLTAGSFMIFTLMLTYTLGSVSTVAEYEPGAFIFLAALLTVWGTRRKLHKGEPSLWFGAATLVLGLAIFAGAVWTGNVYAQFAGFMLTASGIVCAHYTREAADRLVFPLACMVFAIAPPALAPETVVQINTFVAQASIFVLQMLHIPSAWGAESVKVGDYAFILNQDLGAYRAFVCALPVIAFFVYHRARLTAFDRCVMFVSAAFFAVLGIIMHRVGTGWLSYTYGPAYADWFFDSLGPVVLVSLGLFAAIDAFLRAEPEL